MVLGAMGVEVDVPEVFDYVILLLDYACWVDLFLFWRQLGLFLWGLGPLFNGLR